MPRALKRRRYQNQRWDHIAAWLVLAALSVLSTTGCQAGFDTGKVTGQVRFASVSTEVADYFAGIDVVGSCVYLEPVRAYRLDTGSLAASSDYNPFTAIAFPALADYELHPPVGEDGSEFRVNLDSVCFGNGAAYRFGKLDPSAPAQFLTGVVPPESSDPVGVTLDLVECPAMLHANVRLVGDSVDIDGIAEPIDCRAEARIRENGVFERQALSSNVAMAESEIKGSGADLPIVVRGDGSEVQVVVTCSMNTTIPGFPIDVSAGVFEATASSLPVTVSCGDSTTIDVPIHVERTAGVLEGKIGLGTSADFIFKVWLEPLDWMTDQNVAASGPPYLWRFDAAPAGHHEVNAELYRQANRLAVGFPHLVAPNTVEVEFDEVTDLGSTFVSRPAFINGSLTLRDPRASSPLSQMVFADLFESTFDNSSTTMARAKGVEGVYLDGDGVLGVDGVGAYARMVPSGSFDSSTGQAQLSYTLPIVGLSEVDGAIDGTEARTALWELDRFDVFLGDPNSAYTQASFGPLFVAQYPSIPQTVYSVPDIDVCFGDLTLNFVSASAQNLYHPWLYIQGGSLTSAADDNGNTILYRAGRSYAYGEPVEDTGAAPSVSVTATLPAFIQYDVYPRVWMLPPSGDVSYIYLDHMSVPSDGGVSCGGSTTECVLLENGLPASELTATIDTDADFCVSDPVTIPVHVETNTGTITLVDLTLDSQPAVRLCTNCTSPFSTVHSFGSVGAGLHMVTVYAEDDVDCDAGQSEPINVVDDPILICPDDITRILGQGQESLAYDDIAANLQAEWSHTCASNRDIGDDHSSPFPIGETTVTFFALGDDGEPDMSETCTTTVTVKPPNGCSSFEGVPLGPVPTVWDHDRARYTNLMPITTGMFGTVEPNPLRLIDEYPRGIGTLPDGDGVPELTVSGGVRIDLPFEAGWAEIQYDVAHPDPVVIKAFDAGGNLLSTFTSESHLDEGIRHYSQITGDGIAYLEMSGAQNEAAIHKVCFCHSICLPGDANITVVTGIP